MSTQTNLTNLIVHCLPPSLTDYQFRSIFREIGPLNTNRSNIARDRQSNQRLGYGFVEYKHADHAAKAIARLNCSQLQNNEIKVAYASKGHKVKGANLFIYRLPQTVTQEMLQGMFIRFGTIISARVATDKKTGQSKGYGFVLFDTREKAETAIVEMNGATPQGCTEPLLVNFANNCDGDDRPQSQPMPGGKAATPTLGCGAATGGSSAAAGWGTDTVGRTAVAGWGAGKGGSAATGSGVAAGSDAAADWDAVGSGGYAYGATASGQNPYHGGANEDGSVELIINNIGPDAKKMNLWELIAPYGSILKLNVIRYALTDRDKDHCYVTMRTDADATNVIKHVDGYEYRGRRLKIFVASNVN